MTIKEFTPNHPLIIDYANTAEIQAATRMSRDSEMGTIRELAEGTHDITPPGYSFEYSLVVKNPGNNDLIGEITVTGKEKPVGTLTVSPNMVALDQRTKGPAKIYLNSHSPAPYIIGTKHEAPGASERAYSIQGIVYYDPITPKRKVRKRR